MHPFIRECIGRNDIRNVQRGYLNDVPLYIFPPDVIDGAENQIEISESKQDSQHDDCQHSLFRRKPGTQTPKLFCNGFLDSYKHLFHTFKILTVIHFDIPVLHHTEGFKDETVRIIVAAGGVQQPATCDKAAFGHTLLPNNGEVRIVQDLLRIGIEIAPDTVNPNPLAHVSRNDPVVISLLCQIHIMGIGRTVTEEHGPLDITLNRTLVRG